MLSLPNRAAIGAALQTHTDPTLRALLQKHLSLAEAGGLLDLTHIVVIQPADTEAAIVDELGFSPLLDLDGRRFDEDGFAPSWHHLQAIGGWYELIATIGNDGFAFILLIENVYGTNSELLRMCRALAKGSGGRCVL